jgi:GNAT superfamily N-acetyltransferase
VHADEMRGLVRAGEVAVVYLPASACSSSCSESGNDEKMDRSGGGGGDYDDPLRVVGCMRIGRVSDGSGAATTDELGMVAVSSVVWGGGFGRVMAAFAEEHYRRVLGLGVLRLELLVPQERHDHPFKMRLQGWYERMGFQLIRLGVFQDDYPELAALLREPCEYRVFEESLV